MSEHRDDYRDDYRDDPRCSDYLWDKTGADPEVERLEQLLAPLRHEDVGAPLPEPRRPWWRSLLAIAAMVMLGLGLTVFYAVWFDWGATPDVAELSLAVVEGGKKRLLQLGEEFTPSKSAELVLEDGDREISNMTVGGGSVLRVNRLQRARTHLHLEKGHMEAFVAGDAKERFFQVRTPATNCVDLGCFYTLDVDGKGNAFVKVQLGRVAFEEAGRVVVVPAGATCRASKAHGSGTPRHEDTPALVVKALDELDANPGPAGNDKRLASAELILAFLDGDPEKQYSLIPWHLLQDPSPKVSHAAAVWLVKNRPGRVPKGFRPVRGQAVAAADRQRWRDQLEDEWGW